jgi:hypothetical protein
LRREVSLSNSPGRIFLLSSTWQQDMKGIQSALKLGETYQSEISLADGTFRMNQAPMRDRQGNLLGTLVTLFLLEPGSAPRDTRAEAAPQTA